MRAHTNARAHAHTYDAHTHTHTHTHAYGQVHTHKHTHTCVHTHPHTRSDTNTDSTSTAGASAGELESNPFEVATVQVALELYLRVMLMVHEGMKTDPYPTYLRYKVAVMSTLGDKISTVSHPGVMISAEQFLKAHIITKNGPKTVKEMFGRDVRNVRVGEGGGWVVGGGAGSGFLFIYSYALNLRHVQRRSYWVECLLKGTLAALGLEKPPKVRCCVCVLSDSPALACAQLTQCLRLLLSYVEQPLKDP